MKNQSKTFSEEILVRLCREAFLTPWTYPNPYRNQKQHGKGSGKELCDLLVVFGDNIIIFSDKHVSPGTHPDPEVNWRRWYRMGVEDSFRQLVGAERWIRSFPEQIFLDANCTEPLPVRWPVNPIIHRIVVVRGVTDFPAPHGENAPELSISQEVFKETPPLFVAGQLSATQYCHIFDETSLARVLDWLDTATDFIEYLSAKEVRFTGREAHFAASEADYLASYYANVDDRNLHYFLEDDLELKNNLKDSWSRFEGSSSFMAGKIYNANSYLIDRKIEWFTKALQSGEAESGGWSDDPREALGVLASLSRFQRRLFEQKIRGWV